MSKVRNLEGNLSATAAMGAAAAAMAMDPVESSHSIAVHEEIARIAYAYWQARGCPEGSAEEDWFLAEKTLREQPREAAA